MIRRLLFAVFLLLGYGYAQTTGAMVQLPNVFTNANQFTLGIRVGPIPFSQLSSVSITTTLIFISDGSATNPCTGGGTGALAVFYGGQWNCGGGAVGIQGPITPGDCTYWASTATIGDFGHPCNSGGGGSSPGTPLGSLQGNNASNFGGVPNTSVNFTSGETCIDYFNQIVYVCPAFNWTQTLTSNLTAGVPATVTLTPCPNGINGTDNIGGVYLSGDSNPEFVDMTGTGNCVQNASSGTITFTPLYSHSAGIAIGTGTAGIDEAQSSVHNWGTAPHTYSESYKFILGPAGTSTSEGVQPPTAYPIHGHIELYEYNPYFEASGAQLLCYTRDYCFGQTKYGGGVVLNGLLMASQIAVDGWEVASTQCSATPFPQAIITTATTHGIVPGDIVDIQRTDNNFYWGGSAPIIGDTGGPGYGYGRVSSVTSNTIVYPVLSCPAGTGLANTPGHINVLNAAILDAKNGWELDHLNLYNSGGSAGYITGHFNNGIVVRDDQAMVINNFGGSNLTLGAGSTCSSAHPYCGYSLYGLPPASMNSAIATITQFYENVQCGGNGIAWFGGNTLLVNGGVVEAPVTTALIMGTPTGGFGGGLFNNFYVENGGCPNPETPGGTLSAVGALNYGAPLIYNGGEGPQGVYPSFGNVGGTIFYYYAQAVDSVQGASLPMYFGSGSQGAGTTQNIFWPRVIPPAGDTLTYNIIRSATPFTTSTPYDGGCQGGSVNACGTVATGLAQCSGFYCTYTDTLTATTSAVTLAAFPSYCPYVTFWPGNVVLDDLGTFTGGSGPAATLCTQSEPANFSGYAKNGNGGLGFGQALGGTATLFEDLNVTTGLKGRINLLQLANPFGSIESQIGDYITLDSNPAKTIATTTERAAMDANDIGWGNDILANLSGRGSYFRAPLQHSWYIGCVPGQAGCIASKVMTANTEITAPSEVFQQNVTVLGPTCNGCSPFVRSGTQVADNFQRAGPSLGANWTIVDGTWSILNNTAQYTAVGGDGRALAAYTNGTFSNDQFAIALNLTSAGSGVIGIAVRASNSTTTAYYFIYSSGSFILGKVISGVAATLATCGTGPTPSGYVFTISAQGTTISAQSVSNTGVVISCSVTDSSITSGYPGLFGSGAPSSTLNMANFFGGNLSYSTQDNITTGNLTVNGIASVTGSLSANGIINGGHLLQNSSGNFGGTCTMATSTTCTVILAGAYVTPVCMATLQGTGAVTVIAAECSVSGTTVTVTAASSNSDTWGVFVFGNPN